MACSVHVGVAVAVGCAAAFVDGTAAPILLAVAALVPIAWAVAPPARRVALALPVPPRIVVEPVHKTVDNLVPFELVVERSRTFTPAESRWS